MKICTIGIAIPSICMISLLLADEYTFYESFRYRDIFPISKNVLNALSIEINLLKIIRYLF